MSRTLSTIWFCAAAALMALSLPGAHAEAPRNCTLENGLHVRLVPEADSGNVSVLLAVRAGMLNEGKGHPHLAHIAEHETVFDLADAQLAKTAKEWFPQRKTNAETLGEFMYFDLRCTKDELPTALAIEAARLGKMNYVAATLEREIPRALAEVDHLQQVPGGIGKFALVPFAQAALYGQTSVPLHRETENISLDDLHAFHDRYFGVDSARLVVGDFDAALVRRDIETIFGTLKQSRAPASPRPTLTPGNRRVQWDVAKRHWFIGWNTPPADDADQPALYLAGQLLQIRLFNSNNGALPGNLPLVQNDFDRMLVIGCEAPNNESFESLRKRVESEIDGLAKAGAFDDMALRSLCEQLERFQKMNLDDVPLPAGVTRTMGRTNIELQRLVVEMIAGDFDRFLTRLKSVSPEATRAAIVKWLPPDRACIVEVVPEGD